MFTNYHPEGIICRFVLIRGCTLITEVKFSIRLVCVHNLQRIKTNYTDFLLSFISEPSGSKDFPKDFQWISARKGIKIRSIRIIRVQEINSFQEKIVFPNRSLYSSCFICKFADAKIV